MACHLMDCPHCRAKKWMRATTVIDLSNDIGYFFAVCENCNGAVAILVKADIARRDHLKMGEVSCAGRSFEECGWRVIEAWPKPQFRNETAPKGVPIELTTLFEHSQEAAKRGGYDLAVMGFQRVIQMAQALLYPEFRGNRRSWLLQMIDERRLTADMKSWVMQLKILGEVSDATSLQAEQFASFVHVMLDQMFGTRSRMASSSIRASC